MILTRMKAKRSAYEIRENDEKATCMEATVINKSF